MRIGGSEVSSVTHVIVFSENGADDAQHLSDALVQKFGKSPLSVPETVWVRSVNLHSDASEREFLV